MNAVRKSDSYTVTDIYALPDGARAELIDGELFAMAPPGRTHQKYASSGVREYWIVDPAKQSVMVYNFKQEDEFCLI